MAWKSDLHGFYQSSINDGFLNRFRGHDEEELEDARENLCDVEIKYNEENIDGGESSPVGTHDYSELLKDVGQAMDVRNDRLSPTVPSVCIQPPTPSHLSSCTPSSNGSSRPQSPEIDDREAAFDGEPCLKSGEEGPGSMSEILQDKDWCESLQLEVEANIKPKEEGEIGSDETSSYDLVARTWSEIDKSPRGCQKMDESGNEAQLDACSGSVQGDNEAGDVDMLRDRALVCDDVDDDSSSSLEQVSTTLLTSWTEQQIKQETADFDVSDTVTLDHRINFSPTVTWRITAAVDSSESITGCYADTGDDILQTSIGSATDLREVLERSLQQELESCETVIQEGHGFQKGIYRGTLENLVGEDVDEEDLLINGYNTMPRYEDRTILSGDGVEDRYEDDGVNDIEKFSDVEGVYDTSLLGAAACEEMVRHEVKPDVDDSSYLGGRKAKEHFRKDSGLEQNISDEFGVCLEDLEAISLLRSVEVERAKLEMVRGIRSKLEEACNGIPIEKIPSFVYDQWDELFNSLAEDENVRLREMQVEHEGILQGMKSELDSLRKDSVDLSKFTADKNSSELDNELLRRQIGGLEEFVASLERRVEGKAKENAKLVEEIDELRRLSSEKDNDLKVMGKDHDGRLKEARLEIGKLKEAVLKLESDVKMKDIENRKILAQNEKEKDEMQNDIGRVNSNVTLLRNKLTELQNDNHTFKVANEADQTIIKHLETKVQNASRDMMEVKAEKSTLLAELEGSRLREADMKKKQLTTDKERASLELEKNRILERLRFVQEEKKSIERQLNDKLNTDMKNAEAMLQEIKSLESSLNSVRTEKSHIEDKYNNLKFELERFQLIQNGEKKQIYAPDRRETKQLDDFEEKTDFVVSNHEFAGSRRVLNQKYSIAARSSLETIPSLETFDRMPSAGTFSAVTRSIGSNLSFKEDPSYFSSLSTSSTPFQKAAGTRGSRESHHVNGKFTEKRSFSTLEEPQKPLERTSSLSASMVSQDIVDGKSTNDTKNSDEESVGSYPDFPRDSSSIPPVLVVRTKTLPHKSSDAVGSSKQTPEGVGNVKPSERSRLVEREDTRLYAERRDSRRDSANGRQLVGDAKSKHSTDSQKSIAYSVEDTRLEATEF